MTKKETTNLHAMQKNNKIQDETTTLENLWKIGDTVGLPHTLNYQYMVMQIMTSDAAYTDKEKALRIFEDWARNDGRARERSDTAHAIGCSYYKN